MQKKQTLVQHCVRISEDGNGKGNVFLVYTMKTYRGSRDVVHLILNLGIRWGVVSLKNVRHKMWFDGRSYSLMQNLYGIIF